MGNGGYEVETKPITEFSSKDVKAGGGGFGTGGSSKQPGESQSGGRHICRLLAPESNWSGDQANYIGLSADQALAGVVLLHKGSWRHPNNLPVWSGGSTLAVQFQIGVPATPVARRDHQRVVAVLDARARSESAGHVRPPGLGAATRGGGSRTEEPHWFAGLSRVGSGIPPIRGRMRAGCSSAAATTGRMPTLPLAAGIEQKVDAVRHHRQVVFVKGRTPQSPTYAVFRDTFADRASSRPG